MNNEDKRDKTVQTHERPVEYKQLKNYMHNELGITREWVRAELKEYIAEETRKMMRDKESMENFIRRTIIEELNREYNRPYFQSLVSIDKVIYDKAIDTLSSEIKSKLAKMFENME